MYTFLSPRLDKAVENSFNKSTDKNKIYKRSNDFLPVLYRKNKKNYSMQFLLAAILCASYFFISSCLTSAQFFKEEWNLIIFTLAKLLLFSYCLTIIYSYCLLAWHELLTHGKISYTALFFRFREIAQKVYPATILVALFLLFYKTMFLEESGDFFNLYNQSFMIKRKTLSTFSLFFHLLVYFFHGCLIFWQFLFLFFIINYILIILLLDEMPFKKALVQLIGNLSLQKKILSYLIFFSVELNSSFSAISLYLDHPDGREFLSVQFFSTISIGSVLRIFVRIIILQKFLTQCGFMVLASWLYSRKEQDLPFGPE
jgi:hypothetical protein